MRGVVAALLLWWATACAPVPEPVSDPLLYHPDAFAKADSAVIGIPGALTPVRVLSPIAGLRTDTRAIAFYRLPGFDGRPADEFVNLTFAAKRIARAVAQFDLHQVTLIGHSTGAVIALEAAKAIRQTSPDTDVRVIGISTALPAPQPALAGVRGAAGTVAAALRVGSLDPRVVWLEYYRYLAYGPAADTDPQVARAADDLVKANSDRISLPEDGLGRRHTRALRRWTNPDPDAVQGADVILFHGAVDPIFPPRATARFARTLPGAELRLIPGHGHLLLLTYPALWSDIAALVTNPR
ncbi:MAG: alpha/beta hydrolase [Pseudomonadota bacterium]